VTSWSLRARQTSFPFNCSTAAGDLVAFSADGNGWIDAADFLGAKNGTLGGITDGCDNPGMTLAVWATHSLPPALRDAHVVVWLEWEETGGTLHREPYDHHIQLDNTAPTLPPYPDALQVRLADGTGQIVPACGEAPTDATEFEVWGQFFDLHYWQSS
jgi:hypothetical protein